MEISKKSLKILRFVYRHKSVTSKQLRKKFPKAEFQTLVKELSPLYFSISNYEESLVDGFTRVRIGDNTLYTLNSDGETVVESKQWFNWPYVLSSLVLPIIVGITSSVITALILAHFS